MKRLGIVGGLGAETSAKLFVTINNSIRALTNEQPDIIIENIPLPLHVENAVINGATNDHMIALLTRAVLHLSNAGADLIIIPCNTVHAHIDALRFISPIPILSIIEACAEACTQQKFNNVGLLATTKSVQENIHGKVLQQKNITFTLPNQEQQQAITNIILNQLNNKTTAFDTTTLKQIITDLHHRGAEAIILGCTDLTHIIAQEDSAIPLLDTMHILAQATIDELTKTVRARHTL